MDEWRSDYSWGGYATQRVVRPVEEWKGISMVRAYDPCTSWTFRRQAQIRFMNTAKAAQRAVHQFKGESPEEYGAFAAKLQLSAFHTSYPSPAHVAIGHTVFLELKSISSSLSKELADECSARLVPKDHNRVPGAVRTLVLDVAKAIANRAVLEEASRNPELASVEYYRLFQASQSSLKFPLLRDCIDAIVLFGDALPNLKGGRLHPMTRQILDRITNSSRTYFVRLAETPASELRQFFGAWSRDLVETLLPYLPRVKTETEQPNSASNQDGRGDSTPVSDDAEYRYDEEENFPEVSDRLPPLDTPQPPALTSAPTTSDQPQKLMPPPFPSDPSHVSQDGGENDQGKPGNDLAESLDELLNVGTQASEETAKYGDKREDLVEQDLARKPFSCGPIEDTTTEGRVIEFEMGDSTVGGQIDDRVVALSDDVNKVRELEIESAPIAAALRGMLYPSEESLMRMEFAHTSGSLDPRRLAIAEICQAAYRRFPVQKEPSTSGKAVLLIAADGSGSLSSPQMRMCKLLMSSWLRSASQTNMSVFAALYHSDCGRFSLGTPLVQWVHHPRKTPVLAPAEAVRSVASLPDSGTGAQSDALSLKFMLDEAVEVAKGSRIYLTLISDCAWNKCFHQEPLSPEEEVISVLESFRETLGDRLHVTLVAMSENNQDRLKDFVDKIVLVTGESLSRPEDVAREISQYVASCIRERRRTHGRRT